MLMKNPLASHRPGCMLAATLLVLAGCKDLERPASVHVAVLSVAPWDDYRDAVRPTFKLSSDEALALSLPTTAALEEKVLDAFSAKLKVALPGTTLNDTKTTHTETGQPTTAKEDVVRSTTSGDASKLSLDGSPAGDRKASSVGPTNSALATGVGLDPFTRYLTATALYQEVQILNRYVMETAASEHWTPYLVRLQVSLMPFRRDLPYDAYSLISFFHGRFDATGLEGSSDAMGIRIIPLLVTDNLEAILKSHSVETIRQYALALSAVVYGVGASGGLEQMNDKLRSVLGRDLNSTFTVARLCNNTLECRFGASYSPQGAKSSSYAMVPQTHNVTLLVLVPRKSAMESSEAVRTVRLIANTLLRNATTGEEILPYHPTHEQVEKSVTDVLANYELTTKTPITSSDVVTMARLARSNDFPAFKTYISKKTCGSSTDAEVVAEFLWNDIVGVRNGSRYATADFVVPIKQELKLDYCGKEALLMDDGKVAASVTLTGKGFVASDLSASLKVENKSNKKNYLFPADSIKVPAGGKQVVLSFPSLASCKLDPNTIELILDAGQVANKVPCTYVLAATSRKPGFNMTSRARFINAEGNTGTLRILFVKESEEAKIRFKIDGADVKGEPTTEPTSSCVQRDGAGWIVTSNTTVKVELTNLNSFTPVVVSGFDDSNKTECTPLVFPVLIQTSPKATAASAG